MWNAFAVLIITGFAFLDNTVLRYNSAVRNLCDVLYMGLKNVQGRKSYQCDLYSAEHQDTIWASSVYNLFHDKAHVKPDRIPLSFNDYLHTTSSLDIFHKHNPKNKWNKK